MKEFFTIIGGFVAFLLLVFCLHYFGLFNLKFFGPQYRAAENQIFKESEQYNDGMIRDLQNLRLQYIGATDQQKQALKATIIHRFSVYDTERLPSELRMFYRDITGDGL